MGGAGLDTRVGSREGTVCEGDSVIKGGGSGGEGAGDWSPDGVGGR